MHIRSFLNSAILSAVLLTTACRGYNTMNGLTRIDRNRIVLSLDEMICSDSGSMKSDTIGNKPKYVHYIGADKCSACELKSMYLWDDFIEANGLSDKIDFFFIVAPGNDNINELLAALNTCYFSHPIYIDIDNIFEADNSDIISTGITNSYLLDSRNRITLAGNPMSNEAMRNLFQATLDNMLANDGVYVPEK